MGEVAQLRKSVARVMRIDSCIVWEVDDISSEKTSGIMT